MKKGGKELEGDRRCTDCVIETYDNNVWLNTSLIRCGVFTKHINYPKTPLFRPRCIEGKVLKPKIISLQPQKNIRSIFDEHTSRILEPRPQGLISSMYKLFMVHTVPI